jgi:hypothetical protein
LGDRSENPSVTPHHARRRGGPLSGMDSMTP